MEILIASLFIVTSLLLIVGTFVEGVIGFIMSLMPSVTPEWVEALAEALERRQ